VYEWDGIDPVKVLQQIQGKSLVLFVHSTNLFKKSILRFHMELKQCTLFRTCEEKNIEEKDYASSSQEMVLLVGQPSSGKTTFAKRYFVSKSYVHVNRVI
jgi:polynucleotide 5'-kinase involved in rRNA processing